MLFTVIDVVVLVSPPGMGLAEGPASLDEEALALKVLLAELK